MSFLRRRLLGRLASRIAHWLRGKHKAEFTPHVDTGDHIIMVNTEKVGGVEGAGAHRWPDANGCGCGAYGVLHWVIKL